MILNFFRQKINIIDKNWQKLFQLAAIRKCNLFLLTTKSYLAIVLHQTNILLQLLVLHEFLYFVLPCYYIIPLGYLYESFLYTENCFVYNVHNFLHRSYKGNFYTHTKTEKNKNRIHSHIWFDIDAT